ncbi:NAD(P)-dependent alcohol dehydrogenase [Tenacibaculum aiptasiae]|uniref:NAD(P)-dependent alcohol dehydrogenase n=1 Tax=Tenacibaculum aiptasiae TaxID=426481 RepID=UPI003B5AE0F7
MKAITKYQYGGPNVLNLENIEKPTVKENHLLVKVKANSINAADWRIMRGKPYFARLSFGVLKPKNKILGADFAGIVEEVGKGITKFKVGDSVFGEMIEGGAFAEYINAPEKVCGLIPDEKEFIEMASIPMAGLTALQALITHGKLQKGESVLINGASGGVGHLTLQVAKAYGAHVTAICSHKNVDFVKSIGADKVLAYDITSIHQHKEKYDLVIDAYGNLNYTDYKRMAKRGVVVGFTNMRHLIPLLLKTALKKFPLAQFTAQANTKDLNTLAELIKDNKIKPYIEKKFSYTNVSKAIEHIESMRTRGKIVLYLTTNHLNNNTI